MKDISKKTFWIIIVALILIRIVMVVLLIFDIPYIGAGEGDWLFLRGADPAYFELAKSFAALDPIETSVPIGFPLYLAPFIYIFQASEVSDIVKPAIILQAFILFSLAIVLVGLIAKKILKSRLAGLLAASFFTFLPHTFYFLFKNVGPVYDGFTSSVFNFGHMMWIHFLTDPLSAFLVYLAFYLFLVFIEKKKINKQWLIFLGILSGFAVLVRTTNIFIVGVFVLILVVQKKIGKAGLVAIFSFLAVLPQLIYNYIFFGSPLLFKNLQSLTNAKTAIKVFGDPIQFRSIAYPGFSISNYNYYLFLADRYIPMVELVLIFLIILFVFGLVFLYKRNRLGLAVMMLWLLPYLAFYGLFPPAARNVRYHFPIIPPLIILGISSLFFISQRLKELTIYFRKKYAKFSA